jgi:hypothetical protein
MLYVVQELKLLREYLSACAKSADNILNWVEEAGSPSTKDDLSVDWKMDAKPKIKESTDQFSHTYQEAESMQQQSPKSPSQDSGVPCSPGPSHCYSQPRHCGIGCGPSHPNIRSFASNAEIFVSNVNSSVNVSDLMEFLKLRTSVLGLTQISHPHAASKSFVLEIPFGLEGDVLNAHFWPPGIKFRRFVRPSSGRLART